VGSGTGAITAAFAAVSGGAGLYGKGGLWDGAHWRAFYRLRPALRAALLLLGLSFSLFALPVLVGLLLGILFPLLLIADRVSPGIASRVLSVLWVAPEALSGPYLAAQAVPILALAILAILVLGSVYWRRRGRLAEAFEALLDAQPALDRLRRRLWEVARGAALSDAPVSEAELGRRYVALLSENLGELGFRELIVRVSPRPGARWLALLRDEIRRAPTRTWWTCARPGRGRCCSTRSPRACCSRWRCRCGAWRSRRGRSTPARPTV
jgi:hypothetical protein